VFLTKIVAFQGVKGAYSEQAALQFFKGRTKADPSTEFVDVFEKVTKNKVDYGILPIENSLTGSIHQNYDLLLQNDVWIIGEVNPRHQNRLFSPSGFDAVPKISKIPKGCDAPSLL
jgi:prephenate dehydratase